MATVKSDVNFKVELVEFLSTHSIQMMTGNPLTIPDKTRAKLVDFVKKYYEVNKGEQAKDFVMLDGEGKTIASMPMAVTSSTKFKTFLEAGLRLPAQASFLGCDKVVKCIKTQQQHLAHIRLASNDYVYGGISKSCPIPMIKGMVPKPGYCFLNVIVALSYFVTAEFDQIFESTISDVMENLGPWPKLEAVSKAVQFIIAKVPILGPLPIPSMAINHEDKLIHICDQRGVPNGWHVLKVGTASELANAGLIKGSTISGNFVGVFGDAPEERVFYVENLTKVKHALTKWRKPEAFLSALTQDINLMSFLLMSPSLLVKLQRILEKGANEALMLDVIERSTNDKIITANLIKAALEGITVKLGETKLEKVWLHLLEVVRVQLDYNECQRNKDIIDACGMVYNQLCKEKKSIYHYEKQVYLMSEGEFQRTFYYSPLSLGEAVSGFVSTKFDNLLAKPKLKLNCFSDGIDKNNFGLFLNVMNISIIKLLLFAGRMYNVFRVFFCLCAFCWGFMSLGNLAYMAFKTVVLRRLSGNYEKLLIFGCVFALYEVGSFIVKKRKEKQQKSQPNEGEFLQAYGKSSEKKMMSAMAMITLFVHAFDMDLALMMSNSLNHVARLANMLTDTTSGWLVGGANTQELQMRLFDVVLEVDEVMEKEVQQMNIYEGGTETFSSWINEQIALGNDNTRPLAYGRDDSVFFVDRENAVQVGQDMTETRNAWSQVVGQTGSGKSTRVPLAYYNKLQTLPGRARSILICEPTKATTQNVASAISHQHGKQVYFKHEGKEQAGDPTIQVMTYGTAFFRACNNPVFIDGFDAVFLDESHLVSAHALALESLLNKQTHTRKFYVSATPRRHVNQQQGTRRFQIFEHHIETADVSDFISSIGKNGNLDATQFGDKILVFLSGKKECDRAAARVCAEVGSVRATSLHSGNFETNYDKICNQLDQPGKFIIFCTNILETGVTLNVDVVVDFGFTNTPLLNTVEKTLLLHKRRVTKSERQQRVGRAGRLRNGHAIIIGKVSEPSETVSAEVVFEAALISFVYNLDVYVNAHFDAAWLGSITKEQARTMLSFRVSPFIMRDLVFPSGHVRQEMLNCLKNKLQRSASIKTANYTCVNHVYESWPKMDHPFVSTIMQGEPGSAERLSKLRTPFVTHDIGDLNLEEFLRCVDLYKPSILTRWGRPVKQSTNVLMHVSSSNVHETIRVATLLRHDYNQQIHMKQHAQRLHQDSPFAYFFSKKTVDELSANIGKQVAIAQRNIQKLDKFISNLEIFVTMNEVEGDIELTQQDMHEIGQSLDLQADGKFSRDTLCDTLNLESLPSTTFRDAVIIGRKKAVWAIMILCCAAFGGLVWWLMWDDDDGLNNEENKQRRKEVCEEVLEMKGKSFNRDRRNPMMQDTIDMADFYMRDNEDFVKLRKKKNNARDDSQGGLVQRFMSQSKPFITLYDINNDADIVNAVFMDHNKQAFYETANPLKNMEQVRQHLDEHKEKEGGQIFWGDDADYTLFCNITKRDGSVLRVRLTPHMPHKSTTSGGAQGFQSKADCYRQTGETEVLVQPTQNLEIDTRLPVNNINLDVANMIGKVRMVNGSLHCILYKEFIILPAHAMMSKFPIDLVFKHKTITINELPEAYCFPGFDIMLIKRPTSLAPVACRATVAQASDGIIVQIVHKKHVTEKTVLTVTAPTHQRADYRWAHQIPTVAGMCGAPVLEVATGKIVGIHVMGDTLMKHNVFESFNNDIMALLNTNDKKTISTFQRSKLTSWSFMPEVHGYDPKKLKNLQHEQFEFLEFSRDTSVYTVENMNADAKAGGLFTPRTLEEPRSLPPSVSALHMDNLAYMNGLLNPRHVITGESPYWLEFKRFHPRQVKGIEEFENKYAPSVLSYDAYWKDLLKFNRLENPKLKYDRDALKHATLAVVEQLKRAGLTETKIRTSEEVLGDIQWGKAAGPMYAMKKNELCKNLTDEELTMLSIHCKKQLIEGKNCGVWNGSLKAELRTKEKVSQNKTRVFTAAPITTLVASKHFVDDFNKQFYATHLKANHTVGINKFQRGWEDLYKFLDRPGWLHGSGDGTRFDSSLDPFWFDLLYSIRCHFFNQDDQAVAKEALKHMYREFVFTPIHTTTGQVLMKKVGNNSGQPSTVVDNTLILMLAFTYAYIRKTGDTTCEKMDSCFRFVCNGDDNKYSISKEFNDTYSGDFSKEIGELGLVYEFDELTDDITLNPYMSLVMIRTKQGVGFQLHPERIVAIVQWIKRGDILQATQAALAATIEAFNDPWLFGIMHLYLVWLICENSELLAFACRQEMQSICYMDAYQIFSLHYDRQDDSLQPLCDETSNENQYLNGKGYVSFDEAEGSQVLEMDLESTPAEQLAQKEKGKLHEQKRDSKPESSTQVMERNSKHNNQPIELSGDVDDDEIEWRIPAISKSLKHVTVPRIKGKAVWNQKILKKISKEQYFETTQMATSENFEKWMEAIRKNLGTTTEADFQICLTSWCLWTANNGTSPELDPSQVMEVHANGQIIEVPVSIFIEPAATLGGLRKIMRRLSGVTSKILEEGGVMTAWGKKRGFTQRMMIPYAFDAYMQTDSTPKIVREQLNQSKAAAIGSGVQRAMLLDGKLHRSKISYERHTDDDRDEYEHSDAGDQRPTLY
ncbi:polyprotein [Yam chlorotic necrosis virus]|uniref:Polyprotein n=1 Tax=Yam chlorotic necrosis virus TaxID=2175329 RepID=A0A2S1PRI9_9POTY|nr:polyprotein [Yam chlorotic necrosis virus]AWH61232.1 polyprotein [Yam chlorotic necrosis virus]